MAEEKRPGFRAEEELTVRIVSPRRTVFEGPAYAVVAPAWDGKVGILRGHAPFITLLGTGDVRVVHPGYADFDGEDSFAVDGGVLEVVGNTVTILSEGAEAAEADEG